MYDSVVSSRFWKFAHKIGFSPFLKAVYWGIKLRLHQYSLSKTVNEVTATFDLHDDSDFKRLQNLSGEKEIMESLLNEIEDNDTFYDVGANIGLYSCPVLAKDASTTVISFEPTPKYTKRLQDNLEKNGDDWRVFEVALADTDGESEFSLSGSNGEESLSDVGDITVQKRCTKSLINDESIPSPDIMKIDVEGAELLVLKGLGNHLQDIRTIYCELHPKKIKHIGGSIAEVKNILKGYGFRIEMIGDRGDEQHIRAYRDD